MRICDICKTRTATCDRKVTTDNIGHTHSVELCNACNRELATRKIMAEHQAYLDTVKAMTGKTPPKFHWWNPFTWYIYEL